MATIRIAAARIIAARKVAFRITPVRKVAFRIAAARKRKRPGQSRAAPGCIPRPCAI